jgi:predicted amidohydrolase
LLQLAAEGVSLAVLPEMWSTGFAYPVLPELAAESPAMLSRLGELAREHRMTIIGSMPEPAEGNVYNTASVLGPDGSVLGSYRKVHLFSLHHEDRHFKAGRTPLVCETGMGRIGVMICYDLRFPELSRTLALKGATVLVVAAQWPVTRISHWQTLLRARAIENQVFVVAANSCGRAGELTFGGASAIVSPWGEVMAEAGSTEQQVTAVLDFAELERCRETIRCFADRVPEAYEA